MSAIPSRVHEEMFPNESLCWTDKRGSVFLSHLFNRFDGEYKEGAAKKHRPKERCRVLDKNDTIKMRNWGLLKGKYNYYSTIYKFFTLLVYPHDTADRGDGQIQSRWPGFLAPCSSFPFEQARRRKGGVILPPLSTSSWPVFAS